MNCMKCGVKIGEGQVFCAKCLEVMARYPVKPGTVVKLPSRVVRSEVRKPAPRKKEVTVERRLVRCKRIIGVLSALLVLAVILLGLCAWQLYPQLREEQPSETKGQNYSTIAPEDNTT